MAKEVKLLGAWPSPFVMRCRIGLHIKSVDYEFIQETMQPKSELLLKSNPVYKKIPVLLHNHLPVCESLIILHYIDEAFSSGSAPSLLPSLPYDRAIHRFWAAYIDDKVFYLLFFFHSSFHHHIFHHFFSFIGFPNPTLYNVM